MLNCNFLFSIAFMLFARVLMLWWAIFSGYICHNTLSLPMVSLSLLWIWSRWLLSMRHKSSLFILAFLIIWRLGWWLGWWLCSWICFDLWLALRFGLLICLRRSIWRDILLLHVWNIQTAQWLFQFILNFLLNCGRICHLSLIRILILSSNGRLSASRVWHDIWAWANKLRSLRPICNILAISTLSLFSIGCIAIHFTDNNFIVIADWSSFITFDSSLVLYMTPVTISIVSACSCICWLFSSMVFQDQLVLHRGLQSIILNLISFSLTHFVVFCRVTGLVEKIIVVDERAISSILCVRICDCAFSIFVLILTSCACMMFWMDWMTIFGLLVIDLSILLVE